MRIRYQDWIKNEIFIDISDKMWVNSDNYTIQYNTINRV